MLAFTFHYLRDVFGGSIHLLRKPLSFLVFIWLFAFILSYISSALTKTLRPLCFIPGIRGSNFCLTTSSHSKFQQSKEHKGSPASPQWANYPGLMNAQSLTFEQLLDDSVGGSGLSLDIKKVVSSKQTSIYIDNSKRQKWPHRTLLHL